MPRTPWWWRASSSRSLRSNVARGCAVAAALVVFLAAARDVQALTARVRWLPGSGAAAIGYDVFVRRSGQAYGAAIDAGLPAPGAGGVLAYDVENLADGAAYYFSVIARGANGSRSGCAGELVLGQPDGCLVERCCPGVACTSSSAPDGAACDATDACRLCRAAACTPAAENALETFRLKITERPAGPRVIASGRFSLPALTPDTAGLTLSVFDATGAVLLTDPVPPGAVRASATTKSFSLAREYRDGALQMLSLRTRRGGVVVRARLGGDPGAATGPLGWAVASGQSCARSAPLSCTTSARGLSCR